MRELALRRAALSLLQVDAAAKGGAIAGENQDFAVLASVGHCRAELRLRRAAHGVAFLRPVECDNANSVPLLEQDQLSVADAGCTDH